MNARNLKTVIDTEYKEYSMYVLENRAIPSMIDGLKPVQRKLLYSMLKNGRNKKTKLAELGGGLSSFNYHHGEVSATDAAVKLCQDWSNNLPLFEGHGNFGSRLVQEAAAPRYIFCSLSKHFDSIFLDTNIAPKSNDDENPEPMHYLPIIPWVLVNGIKGVAIGFATDILPRDPVELINYSIFYLSDTKQKVIPCVSPCFPSFKGMYDTTIPYKQWKTRGIIESTKTGYRISELPVGYDRESYVNLLNDFVSDNKISDYDDMCSEEGFDFLIKVNREQRKACDKDLIKFFKLEKSHTENITVIDETGRVRLYANAIDLIHDFCDYRLSMYDHRIKFMVDKWMANDRISRITHGFITSVVEGILSLRESTTEQLKQRCMDLGATSDEAADIIAMPISKFSTDSLRKLTEHFMLCKQQIDYWSNASARDLYLHDLKELKKQL